jgi:ABC-type nitrate/sulfonate/bicarbonate transport system substrate-binding protein
MARPSNLGFSYGSFLFVTIAVCALLGKVSPSQGASASLTKVVIGYPSPTPRVAPLWIAQDLDFFGKYGLTAQLVP